MFRQAEGDRRGEKKQKQPVHKHKTVINKLDAGDGRCTFESFWGTDEWNPGLGGSEGSTLSPDFH